LVAAALLGEARFSRESAQARLSTTLLPQGGPKRGAEPMKIVMAIIKPFKLEEVRDALTGACMG
jgi:hypothetical protein